MPPHLSVATGWPARVAGVLCCLTIGSTGLPAQAGPAAARRITAGWATDQFLSGRSAIELAIDHPLDLAHERLAVLVGTTDVSGLVEMSGVQVRYQPGATPLPAGESEVAVYLVTGGRWEELGRFPLKVRNRAGLDRQRIAPSLDLSTTGQLNQGGTNVARPERRTYQEVTLRVGLESEIARGGWRVAGSGNALGVTQETQRLRWAAMQSAAPAVDLSDYRLQVTRASGTSLAVGNVSVAGHRYLIDGFGSRGATAALRLGSRAGLDMSMVNGTNVVGWSNLAGLGQPDHRISAATLSLELLPAQPGALHVALSGLDGSVLPITGFNQGAATDAETSRGFGARVTMSDARQRVRFDGGWARSRFVNPADPLLSGETTLVAVKPTARTARYGELALQLVQDRRIVRSVRASLGASLRHERVDPLFRSVGASPQADLESNGAEVTGALGALALQGAYARTHDNLNGIRSILTSRTRNASVALALPVGVALRRPAAWYLPQLSYGWQRTGQLGAGVPENGDFSLAHVPNQVSVNQTGGATWTHGTTSLAYRWNHSFQDNRQIGRERADFRAIVHGLALSTEPVQRISATVDLGLERQTSIETDITQQLERLGSSLRWQVTRLTDLSGTLSQTWAFDPQSHSRQRNTELQVEMAQGINLYRKPGDGSQGRLFVRFGRTRAASSASGATDVISPIVQWTLNAGGSFRLY
jgi:hypothetical protein